jgi:hypothetical protein
MLTGMHIYLVVTAWLAVVLMAAAGIAGVTTGWVVPLGRHRVLRPKLWGCGQLLGAVGFALWMFLGVLPARLGVLPLLGWCLFMGSVGVGALAKRPGRTTGHAPGRTTGHAPGGTTGHAPGGTTGRAPGRTAARFLGRVTGRLTGRAPGGVSGRPPTNSAS